jgi:hypothetical protein
MEHKYLKGGGYVSQMDRHRRIGRRTTRSFHTLPLMFFRIRTVGQKVVKVGKLYEKVGD